MAKSEDITVNFSATLKTSTNTLTTLTNSPSTTVTLGRLGNVLEVADPIPPFQIENAMDDVIEYDAVRYRCPFCRKTWAKRSACFYHITDGCHKDPRTATCSTCKFLAGDDLVGTWDSETAHCAMECERFKLVRVHRPKDCEKWQPKGKV